MLQAFTARRGQLLGLIATGMLALVLSSWRSLSRGTHREYVATRTAVSPPLPAGSLHPRSASAPRTAKLSLGGGLAPPAEAPELGRFEGGTAPVTGSVVDVSGGFVVGARVIADRLSPRASTVGRASTDAQGRFALNVPAGSVEIEVSAEGYAPARISAVAPAAELAVALVVSSSVRGRVVERGTLRPTAEVRVTATSLDGLRAGPVSVLTDPRGEFSLDRLPPGSYELEAASSAWRSDVQRLTLAVGAELDQLQLEVAPATSLTGVVQTGGKPCTLGYVELGGPSRSAQALAVDGRVLLDGLLPGQYRASIECEGAEQSPWEEELQIGRQPLTRVWELLPRQRAELRDERPLAAIELTLLGKAPATTALTALAIGRTGPPVRGRSGERLVFEDLPLDEYQVYLEQAPNACVSVQLTRAGELAQVQLEVPAVAEIAGRVLDGRDLPVPDAWVRASTPAAVADPLLSPVLTDAEGEFVIRGRLAGLYTLQVESESGTGVLTGVSPSRGNVVRLGAR